MPTGDIKKTALTLLARREHSYQELFKKLLQRKFDSVAIDTVLKSLIEVNLLSDRRFAEVFIRSRIESGYGPLRIQNELKQKGISDDIIQEVLFEGHYNWAQLAQRVYQKKYLGKPTHCFSEKAKQMHFLQYRGFTLEQIRSAINLDEDIS